MKDENKTTGVLILIFPGKIAFYDQRKFIKNDSAKLFLTRQKFNHNGRPSFYRKRKRFAGF